MLRARWMITQLSRQARADGRTAAWQSGLTLCEALAPTCGAGGAPLTLISIVGLQAGFWRGFQATPFGPAAAAAALEPAPPPRAWDAGAPTPAKLVLYRGKGMQLFRLLVRCALSGEVSTTNIVALICQPLPSLFPRQHASLKCPPAFCRAKVFQLAGIAALAVPINTFLATGSLASTQAVMAGALVVGAGVASSTLWYYSRRYVGELALVAKQPGQPPLVRLSVLDFWGNREVSERVCGSCRHTERQQPWLAAALQSAPAPQCSYVQTMPPLLPTLGGRAGQ